MERRLRPGLSRYSLACLFSVGLISLTISLGHFDLDPPQTRHPNKGPRRNRSRPAVPQTAFRPVVHGYPACYRFPGVCRNDRPGTSYLASPNQPARHYSPCHPSPPPISLRHARVSRLLALSLLSSVSLCLCGKPVFVFSLRKLSTFNCQPICLGSTLLFSCDSAIVTGHVP